MLLSNTQAEKKEPSGLWASATHGRDMISLRHDSKPKLLCSWNINEPAQAELSMPGGAAAWPGCLLHLQLTADVNQQQSPTSDNCQCTDIAIATTVIEVSTKQFSATTFVPE